MHNGDGQGFVTSGPNKETSLRILLVKKLEIEKTKTTFIISVLKVVL